MYSRTMTRAAIPALLAMANLVGVRAAMAQRGSNVVPADTVIRVRLDQAVSSRNARVGDRVMATVVPSDRSGFPTGTRFEGTITDAKRSSTDEPGVLGMDWRRAILPDGQRVAIDGRLASLADEDVRRTNDGRLESRRGGSDKSKFDAKWVGYGAAGGAVLATIFGSNFLKGALLGGLGGAVYGYLNKDKGGDRFHDVALEQGQEFGIRMENRVAFNEGTNYRYARDDRFNDRDDRLYNRDRFGNRDDRVLGNRQEWRFNNANVRVNGRAVNFTDDRPLNLNGMLFIPLRPVAEAANLRFDHYAGDETFTLRTRDGDFRGRTGDATVRIPGGGMETLDAAPVTINGEVFVSTEFLSRVADMRVNWDRRNMRLDLDTYATR